MIPLLTRCYPLCLSLALALASAVSLPLHAELIQKEGKAPTAVPKLPLTLELPTSKSQPPKDAPPISPMSVVKASVEELIEASDQAYDEDNLARAIFYRTRALAKDPNYPGKLDLARMYAQEKNTDGALYWLSP